MKSAFYLGYEVWGGIFCLITAILILIMRRKDELRSRGLVLLLLNAVLLAVSDIVYTQYEGADSDIAYYATRISTFCTYMFYLTVTPALSLYLTERGAFNRKIKGVNQEARDLKILNIIQSGICLVGLILLIMNQFVPVIYEFNRENAVTVLPFQFILLLFPIIGCIVIFIFRIREAANLEPEDKAAIIIGTVLPVASFIVHIFYQDINIPVLGLILMIQIMMVMYEISYNRVHIEAEKSTSREEKDYIDQRIRVMQSQMRPHFIFNSLLAVKQLCYEDPEKAADALQNFAGFLRMNLEALSSEQMVPFLKELECIKEYVALEQADPASHFNMQYNIDYSDFTLPILSVQPMVENAIRHGVSGRGPEGLVKLSTWLEGNTVYITVEDNGFGYISETRQQAEHRSIGIDNVKERLALSCNGVLSISNTGNGTIVTITIPQEQEPEAAPAEIGDAVDE